MSRRDLLAGGLAAGLGAVGLAACGGSEADPLGAAPTSAEAAAGDSPSCTRARAPSPPGGPSGPQATTPAGRIRSEPPVPPDHTTYVTRPDLTPLGVSIVSTAAWRASLPPSTYLFAAPKNPLAANPGAAPPGHRPFPAGAQPGLMIIDLDGDLVWFKPLPGPHEIPFNFRVQTYRGRPTLTWFQGTLGAGHAVGGHYVLADHTYREITQVTETRYPCDLHEFILTPQGTALHTAYEPGVAGPDGSTLVVGHALEVDVAGNDLLFDWPSYPAVSPSLSYTSSKGDYFHINSIGLWPGPARDLLVSSRNTSAIYLIDRRRNEVTWRLGGKRSDFAMAPGVPFYFQHDARALPDGSGVSLFDDASQPCPEKVASGKVLNLDQQARRATLRHRMLHTDHELDTPSQGNCELLGNGGHVVGWGYLPFFSAYAPVPEDRLRPPLVMDGRFPPGAASYRTFLFGWKGRPPIWELRAVVRRTAGTGRFRVWVSWNGATEVASWHVRAGRSNRSLRLVATARRRGFETAIDVVREGAQVFEVSGVDRSGRTLGRTEVVVT